MSKESNPVNQTAPAAAPATAPAHQNITGLPTAELPPVQPVSRPLSHAERNAGGYKPKSIGYPVERPDMTWHDLTPEQRQSWMRNHENKWKQRFGRQGGDMQPDLQLSRG